MHELVSLEHMAVSIQIVLVCFLSLFQTHGEATTVGMCVCAPLPWRAQQRQQVLVGPNLFPPQDPPMRWWHPPWDPISQSCCCWTLLGQVRSQDGTWPVGARVSWHGTSRFLGVAVLFIRPPLYKGFGSDVHINCRL